MKFKDFLKKMREGKPSPREDLYIRILLWAYEKQETGFTWQEMRNHFGLDDFQMNWVRKIFLTTSDSDRKFFEDFRDDITAQPNLHYYSLNEKGSMAVINYKGLAHAEKNSQFALWLAIISIILTALGLLLTREQLNLTEIQSTSDRITQAQSLQSAIEFCKQNPTAPDSGLFEIDNGKSAPCSKVLQNYPQSSSIWDRIKSLF